jgi:hypothetical protein
MRPAHKLLVVEPQDRVAAVQEVGVEHDLDAGGRAWRVSE